MESIRVVSGHAAIHWLAELPHVRRIGLLVTLPEEDRITLRALLFNDFGNVFFHVLVLRGHELVVYNKRSEILLTLCQVRVAENGKGVHKSS